MNDTNLPRHHPELDDLRRFLLGDVREPTLDSLAEHLGACVACQERLAQLALADPLIIALRRPLRSEAFADELECSSTIALLSRSSPAPPPRSAGEGTAPQARSASEGTGDTQSLVAPHLAPTTAPAASSRSHDDPLFSALPCAFGRYHLLERLGKGGMGAVYLAEDTTLERQVALKVSRFAADESDHAERFLREARAAARLRHEGICRILDYGVHDGIHFLTLDYLPGGSLAGLMQPGQRLDPKRAIELVRQVALAMDVAHRQGIVHRDLKPANIMLDEHGQPKVVDFGLARRAEDVRLTRTGTVIGTPAYMSPEQVDGQPTGPATDIYSLGVILYQLLAGRLPFEGKTLSQLSYQIVHTEPPSLSSLRPDLDPHLTGACHKAMAKVPVERFTTMAELAAALITPHPPSPPLPQGGERVPSSPPPSWGRGGGGGAGLLIGGTVLCLLVAAGIWYNVSRPQPEVVVPSVRTEPERVAVSGPIKGWIDVLVSEPNSPRRVRLHLNDPEALPLKPGDQIRIEAELDRPAYLYVVWIDPEGKAVPVYPWRPGHWEERPATEERMQRLSLPRDEGKGWTITPGVPGMDTLLLLVRDEPLPREYDLAAKVSGLPRQQAQNLQAAVWFRNWKVLREEASRGAPNFNDQDLADPLLQTQLRLKERLEKDFVFSRAVSFADRGK
jgi:serine/threonine protein kinase